MDQAPNHHRRHHPSGVRTHSTRYGLMIVASVLLLLAVGVAHDHGHLGLGVSLLAYAAVLAVIVLASRAGAE
jgi:hypothetical protein